MHCQKWGEAPYQKHVILTDFKDSSIKDFEIT